MLYMHCLWSELVCMYMQLSVHERLDERRKINLDRCSNSHTPPGVCFVTS